MKNGNEDVPYVRIPVIVCQCSCNNTSSPPTLMNGRSPGAQNHKVSYNCARIELSSSDWVPATSIQHPASVSQLFPVISTLLFELQWFRSLSYDDHLAIYHNRTWAHLARGHSFNPSMNHRVLSPRPYSAHLVIDCNQQDGDHHPPLSSFPNSVTLSHSVLQYARRIGILHVFPLQSSVRPSTAIVLTVIVAY